MRGQQILHRPEDRSCVEAAARIARGSEARRWASVLARRMPGRTAVRLSRREDGVEQQAEGCERLTAMLHAESEQHDLAGADCRLDDSATTGDRRFALEPAAQQKIRGAVASRRSNR